MLSVGCVIGESSSVNAREFAFEVVRKLKDAQFQALWAGGCVRDQLLGKTPKDYDVATNATPDEVREVFGVRKTIAIGAAFGVITVIGSKQSGNIEIATFRKDSGYSDGRRPDAVEFTDAREDAIRRDFTINGMFYDPVEEQLIDYVEGRADIDCKVIRAIGDPEERIDEDKLRMLRAVRFASTFDFELEAVTKSAIQKHAEEIEVVSAERVGTELRRMLSHPNRAIAAELLKETGLLCQVIQDGEQLYENRANWRTRLRWLDALGSEGSFEQAAAILLSKLIKLHGIHPIVESWKLSNTEADSIQWFETNVLTLSRGHQLPWSMIQPLLINPNAERAVKLVEIQFGREHDGFKFCQQRLGWESSRLNPKPFLDGQDLKECGIEPGPIFSKILKSARAAQLDGELDSKKQAIELAKSMAAADDG